MWQDLAQPARDGAWAWTRALDGAGGDSASVVAPLCWASVAFSSERCLCRDLLQPECDAARGLAPLGYRVECVAGHDLRLKGVRDRVGAYVARRRPVPWFGGCEEGVVVAVEGSCLRLESVCQDGEHHERVASPEDLAGARVHLVRPAPSLREPRIRRDIQQLLLALTTWLMPHAHGGHCEHCDGSDTGAAAFVRIGSALRLGQRAGMDAAVLACRLMLWARRIADARDMAERLAGRSRTPYNTRMRYATECFGDALSAMRRSWSLARSMADGSSAERDTAGIGPRVVAASDAMDEACKWLLAAACIRAQLPGHYADLLLADPREPIAEGHLGDLVYLARAGSVPFRRLAARRMAIMAEDRGVSTTLRQLLYDADDVTALMAANSLIRGSDHAASGAFLDAYLRRDPATTPAPFSIRAELLFDAALTDRVRTVAYLAEAVDSWRQDFSPAGAQRLEQVLGGQI